MNNIKLDILLKQFLNEDIGYKDITSEAIFSSDDFGTGQFLVKENGILAGLKIIKSCYLILDSNIDVKFHAKDGDVVAPGDIIATVSGPIIPLLSGERVILNILQRMSAISTTTKKIIDLLNDPNIRVCDTRKTTPGLKMLEKYAVRCGGGYNHRYGLDDAVMIKDNHIAHSGSITKAVTKVKNEVGHMVKIEVETETKEEVIEAIKVGVDAILLDNCTAEKAMEYCAIIPDNIITEVSGGINMENISEYRNTGVNYISLGMLTHSVKSLDITFNLLGGKKYETKY